MAKILITGATGFLGKFIVDEMLTHGHSLRLLVRNAQDRDLKGFGKAEICEGDILDIGTLVEAMEGMDGVIHAAAVVSFAKRDQALMKKVNVEGTANVVNACLNLGIKRLVHISSTSATGRVGKGEAIDETNKWQDKAKHPYYGRTKRQAELEVHRGVAEGLSAVMLNPAVIIGPGDWAKGPPHIFSMVHKGLRFYNSGTTSLVGAKDVARATSLLYDSQVTDAERFILCQTNLPQKVFLGLVANALGKRPPSILLTPVVRWLVGASVEAVATLRGKSPLISRETMTSSARTTYYSGDKICKLGFKYQPIEEVIEETAKAYLASEA